MLKEQYRAPYKNNQKETFGKYIHTLNVYTCICIREICLLSKCIKNKMKPRQFFIGVKLFRGKLLISAKISSISPKCIFLIHIYIIYTYIHIVCVCSAVKLDYQLGPLWLTSFRQQFQIKMPTLRTREFECRRSGRPGAGSYSSISSWGSTVTFCLLPRVI